MQSIKCRRMGHLLHGIAEGGKVMERYKRAIIKMVKEIQSEEALERIYSLILYLYSCKK